MNSSRRPDSTRAQRLRRPDLYRGRCIRLAIAALCVAWVTMVHPESVLGQNPPPNVQYTNKAVDLGLRGNLTVNPSTRAVEIQIPLGSYPGRAGFDVPIAISYSSKVHNIKYYAYNPGHYSSSGVPIGDGYTMVVARFAEYSSAGWTSTVGFPGFDYSAQYEKYDMFGVAAGTDGQCPYSPCLTVDRVLFRMPDGSTHELRSTDQPRFPDDPLIDDYYSVDGARMRYQKSTDTLSLADGSRYLFGQGKYVDRNGNTITISTDTLGRPIPSPPMNGTGLNGGTPGDPVYSIPGVGGTINYTFKWRYLDDPGVLTSPQPLQYVANSTCPYGTGSYSPYLFFGDGGTHTCILNGGSIFRPVVLYQILLPTGQAYTFTYNIYGEIDKVVLPTGGYERYEYAQFGPLTTNMVAPYVLANRGVTRRYVSPSGSPADELPPWQYSGSGGSVSITAPDNSLTILSLYTDPSMSGTFGYSLDQARAGRTYSEVFYSPPDGNGVRQLLRRHLSDWSVTGSNATGQFSSAQQYATRNARLTKEVEIIFDPAGGSALAKTVTHEYDLTYQFSTGVNETATNEYDYVVLDPTTAQTIAIASVPLGLLKRRTEKTYLDATNAAYRDRNLLGMVTSVIVKDGSANILAQSSITYDETGQPYSQLNDYGSVTNWTDPQTTYRGNPTTTSQWLNYNGSTLSTFPNGTYLTTHAQYDQCGSVRKTWDARDTALTNPSQISYLDAFSDGLPRNTYAFPTNITTAVPDSTGAYGSNVAFTTTSVYDFNTGKVVTTTDANSKTTSYDYTDYLNRLRQVTLPDTARVRYNYFNTPGDLYVQVQTDEDASRSIESRKYFDGLGRPTRSFLYDGTASTPWLVTDTYYDNMGRVSKVSNPYRVSSPGASVPPTCSLCTTSAYDALGRVISATTPDSAQLTSSYGALTSGSILGTTVLVTDQTGKSRRSLTDSLGRLARVDEPDVNGSLGNVSSPAQPTSYSYDVLGNLHLVTQGAQQRFFMYDSLSRLLRARNPELAVNANFPALTDPTTGNGQWSNSYAYDNNANLTQKTDARNVTATYAYDALNRNKTIDYSDTTSVNPDVTRMYDGATNGKGRVWQSYAGGAETLGTNVEHQKTISYDEMGRPRFQQQRFKANGAWSQNIYETQRQYNLAGSVTLQIYPSNHSVTYNYDQAGRLGDKDSQNLAFTGNLGDNVPRTYSRGISYSPFGSIAQEQFGTDTAIYNKLAYNSRGQLAEIKESTTPNDSSWDRGKFVNWYSLGCGGAGCNSIDDNGNLRKQETFVPKGDGTSVSWYQQYDYDTLNRLQRVHEYTGNTTFDWQQEYVYDRYGNRRIEQDVAKTYGSGINKKDFTVNTANNRLGVPAGQTGTMTYDPAGNLTTDTYSATGATRAYDAENRMTSETRADTSLAGSYTYNADGQRVRRKVDGVETWQIYGMDGELLAEYAANAAAVSPQKEYGYRNGQLLITAAAPATTSSGTNVALATNGGTAVASSTLATFNPGGVNDGSRRANTAPAIWLDNTYQSFPDWIEIDFNSSKTISEIDVVTQQDDYQNPVEPSLAQTFSLYGLTAFEVQYWNGSAWANVPNGSVTGNNKVWRQLSFASITTSKIRVVVNAVADNAYCRVVEVEAWESAAQTQPVVWTNAVGVSSSANSLTKTATTGWGNAGASSTQTLVSGDGYVEATVAELGRSRIFGFSHADMSQSWDTIDFGLHCANDGNNTIYVYESGTQRGTFGSYASGDKLRVAIVGGIVKYSRNGTVFYTSTVTPNYPLRMDTALYENGATISSAVFSGASGSSSAINWLVTDQLGTPRMVFDKTGSLAGVKRHDYLPFGEEILAGTGARSTAQGYSVADGVRQKFTQKERDIETGLDYFGARYYASAQGRFTTVDPDNAEAAMDFSDPQSWNGYAYVKNNPCSNTDPDGRCICLFQRLNNFFSGYGPYSNEQLEQKENQWRQYLRDKQKEYGNLVYTDPNTGQQSIVNPETISRAMVFHYAASFREAEYYHRLELYTPQQVNQMPQLAAPVINFGSQQLQKKFKHAGDFGVKGSYNPANAARYQQAVEDHLADPATKVINGTYRGQSVTHYVNSNTGLNVMKDAAGNFLSGWKLSPAQLSHVLTTGKL